MSVNNINGLGSTGNIAATALNAFSKGMNASAHNIANVNTAGFDPIKVGYENLPNNAGVTARSVVGSSINSDGGSVGNSSSLLPPEALDPSGTDLGMSFTDMISTQNAFEANAGTIKVWDSMLGALIDMKV